MRCQVLLNPTKWQDDDQFLDQDGDRLHQYGTLKKLRAELDAARLRRISAIDPS